jgi:hypothetical protein
MIWRFSGRVCRRLAQAEFSLDVEEIPTLKKIDLVFMDEAAADDLMRNIVTEGKVIYEQTSC